MFLYFFPHCFRQTERYDLSSSDIGGLDLFGGGAAAMDPR
jgi:hypothetical protein